MSINNSNFNFLDGNWEEVKPTEWEWIKWQDKGETVFGWIYHIRTEEFVLDGQTHENLVAYMIKVNRNGEFEFIRFIVPTDLKRKLASLHRKTRNLDWDKVLVRIDYNGMVETSKGYKVKNFNLQYKTFELPEHLEIPPLPDRTEEIEELDDDIKALESFYNDKNS